MSRRGQTTIELAIGMGLVITMTTLFFLTVVVLVQNVFLERTLYEATLCLSHSTANECFAQYQPIFKKVSFFNTKMDLRLARQNSWLEGKLVFQQCAIQWDISKQIKFPLQKR